jgi:hypothetical protein
MGACDCTDRGGVLQTGKGKELGNVAFVEAPGFGIGDVGKPLGFRGTSASARY